MSPRTKPPAFRPTYRGFLDFARALGEDLAPFQRTIAGAVFEEEREVAAVLPRGNAKSTTAALLAVHHVVSNPRPSVYVGAGSREQARVIGRIVERYARAPVLRDRLLVRHDELRLSRDESVLLIVASDGGRAHGWERPTLMIGDEVWSWSDRQPTLIGAMQTALVKNRDAKLLLISTAAANLDSALGRMRTRALAQPQVRRHGGLLEARGEGLRWLEWSVPDDAELTARNVKRANPAPWIGSRDLSDQRRRVTEIEFLQFHACRWGVGEGTWLPPGAWGRCRRDYEVEEGEEVFVGVDVGGTRAASAVVAVTRDLRVADVHVFQGDAAVLRVTETVLELAERRTIVEMAFDPWRYQAEALRLEQEHGLVAVQFPQSHARMTAASENLHRVVTEEKLSHPGDPELDRHVASAVAKRTGRGWRLDKGVGDAQIDAVVALAMACERAGTRSEPPRVLGWL